MSKNTSCRKTIKNFKNRDKTKQNIEKNRKMVKNIEKFQKTHKCGKNEKQSKIS